MKAVGRRLHAVRLTSGTPPTPSGNILETVVGQGEVNSYRLTLRTATEQNKSKALQGIQRKANRTNKGTKPKGKQQHTNKTARSTVGACDH